MRVKLVVAVAPQTKGSVYGQSAWKDESEWLVLKDWCLTCTAIYNSPEADNAEGILQNEMRVPFDQLNVTRNTCGA